MQFNNDFKSEIHLKGVKYRNNGIRDYSYKFNYHKIDDYKNALSAWLKIHNIPYGFSMLSSTISIHDCNDFPEKLIPEFEREFEVRYEGYEISCNSQEKTYNFY